MGGPGLRFVLRVRARSAGLFPVRWPTTAGHMVGAEPASGVAKVLGRGSRQ